MEITKNNFVENLGEIVKDLKFSCFVGFDAEFTAILSGECFKHRLFDTCEDRYNNIKNEVSNMIMTQVGLTFFKYESDKYTIKGYTFHLCPQVFSDVDQSFIFQASTLKFLCRHNFDFNKFTYEGIPYLSKAEEAQIRKQIKDKTFYSNLSRSLEIHEEKLVQHYCSEVSKWLSSNNSGTIYLDIDSPILRFVLHNELRIRFPNILTTDSLGNSNKLLIYRDESIEGAVNAPMGILEENLMYHLLGFSRLITQLEKYKKPLVGHNMFLDIVLLHNQFIGPLPKNYTHFKKNINKIFPYVFDTKYISHEMSKKLAFDEVWKSNALQDLYEFFAEGKCRKLQVGLNQMKVNTVFNLKQSYHEAGWDSFCAGYCFYRMGHWAACENRGKFKPIGAMENMSSLAGYCNRINVIRGAVPYMNLTGEDPKPNRPELLHIKSLKERYINVGKVAALLAGYGSIDVKLYSRRTALVAANSQFTVDRILKNFKDNEDYRISIFNKYRHSKVNQVAMWGGALITGSLVLFLLHKKVKTAT